MHKIYVLDACALIAYFRKEPGEDFLADLFTQAVLKQATIVMHKVTLTEVLYDMLRVNKTRTATDLITDVTLLPIELTEVLSDEFVVQAAYFKANYKISFADSFVLALAKLKDADVATADHHEFDTIEKSGEARFAWIR